MKQDNPINDTLLKQLEEAETDFLVHYARVRKEEEKFAQLKDDYSKNSDFFDKLVTQLKTQYSEAKAQLKSLEINVQDQMERSNAVKATF